MTKRLVLADPLSPEGVAILSESEHLDVVDLSGQPRQALMAAIPGSAGLIVRSSTQADADLLAKADVLEVIGRAGVGLDNIDLAEATRRGIAVLNAPAGNTVSTAELAFALLLAAARHIPAADRSIHRGEWERKAFSGSQLHGKTLGVIGAGRIGSAVIRRGRAFGLRGLIYDPFLSSERADDMGAETVSLERLLAESDFVTLHAPLTPDNRGLIGEEAIRLMKPDAFLINAARGGLVDELALAAALNERRLGGAALDVYETEPLPEDHPLRSAPNLVLTPHLGAATPEAQREVAIEIAKAVRDALVVGDLRAAVNVPLAPAGDRERLDPVLQLARRLGLLLSELTGGRSHKISVRLACPLGHGLQLVTAAVIEGYLRPHLARPLNMVNSLLLAADRGIEVRRSRTKGVRGHSTFLEVSAENGGTSPQRAVAAALLGDEHPRLVRVDEYHVAAIPKGNLLFVWNRDTPGAIGEIGTYLGRTGSNIAEFHQDRNELGGEAFAAIRLDEALREEDLAGLRDLPAVSDVRQVVFED